MLTGHLYLAPRLKKEWICNSTPALGLHGLVIECNLFIVAVKKQRAERTPIFVCVLLIWCTVKEGRRNVTLWKIFCRECRTRKNWITFNFFLHVKVRNHCFNTSVFYMLRGPTPDSINHLTLSGYFMYHQVSNKKLNVLGFMSTQWIYVFCIDLRAKVYYFLYSITWLVYCNRDGIFLLPGTNCIFIYNSGKY